MWQDDIFVVTRGTEEEHYEEVAEILNLLEKNGYRASYEKSKFFQDSATWCGYAIDEYGIGPKNSRGVEAVLAIKPLRTLKEVRSFLGAVQYLSKLIPKLSEITQPLRELLKKNTRWTWECKHNAAFELIKCDIANIQSLKHYDPSAETILTTDASTLWQAAERVRRPVAFASKFLSDSEKKYL